MARLHMHKIIVYTPGVYDLIHIGHIEFLRKAKALGDVLIVGVQSDDSVERQKGHRPVISQKDRIATLEALDCVDLAVPYDDFEYINHVEAVNADVVVLSEEHRGAERFHNLCQYLEFYKKRIFYLPYNKSISTTQIKESVKNMPNFWANTWEKVASGWENDYEVVGHHSQDVTWELADYFIKKLFICPCHRVLDFGCGSGVLLKEMDCFGFGIDISPTMIKRAVKNCPCGVFMVSDHIPLVGEMDKIISWGVLHYLPSMEKVEQVLNEMLSLSKHIMIMELPDISKRELRLENRREHGKIIEPEPLYFSTEYFKNKGFEVLLDDPKLTVNSRYSFSVIYDKV